MTKELSDKPSAVRMRRHRAAFRQRLIDLLGGECVECGATEKLEFDHRVQRDWVGVDLWSNHKLRKYAEEIAEGKIELRCWSCNARKGKPEMTAEDLQREHEEWIES